ncbi:MAG: DDE-type integrase/transposase/recombinase [Butyricicoccus sp.]
MQQRSCQLHHLGSACPELVTTMLDKAFEKIPDETGLILHSDQGWQYQHKQYQRMLREKGIRQSMNRKGNWTMRSWKTSSICSKTNCFICTNLIPWNTLSENEWMIWTIATTTVSNQSERACRLQFTDNKPFRLLEPFLL